MKVLFSQDFYKVHTELLRSGRCYFDKRVLLYESVHQWVETDEHFRLVLLKLTYRDKGGEATGF